jgi:hypothetical protein
LIKEGIYFEGVIRNSSNNNKSEFDDFRIKIQTTGYTWIERTILLQKLKNKGMDLNWLQT